jgi:hypothetical protein
MFEDARFEVVIAMKILVAVFWNVTPRSEVLEVKQLQ